MRPIIYFGAQLFFCAQRGNRAVRASSNQWEEADFNLEETALAAQLARELSPALPAIARRWAAEISPQGIAPVQSRQEFAASALKPLKRIIDAIAAENVAAALELCAALARGFAEQRVRNHNGARGSLSDLLAAAAIPRTIIQAEIARRAADRERRSNALLCFTRLWARLAERFAAAYSSAIEADLRRLNADAIESAREKSALAASVAHEIRTPLNLILG